MRTLQTCGVLACFVVLLLSATLAAHAGPYVPQGPFVVPCPGPDIPKPPNVPGKEYSDYPDRTLKGIPTPCRSLIGMVAR